MFALAAIARKYSILSRLLHSPALDSSLDCNSLYFFVGVVSTFFPIANSFLRISIDPCSFYSSWSSVIQIGMVLTNNISKAIMPAFSYVVRSVRLIDCSRFLVP